MLGVDPCVQCEFLVKVRACCVLPLVVVATINSIVFVGSVCGIETIHQLLCFKSKFPNHFAFTFGH